MVVSLYYSMVVSLYGSIIVSLYGSMVELQYRFKAVPLCGSNGSIV